MLLVLNSASKSHNLEVKSRLKTKDLTHWNRFPRYTIPKSKQRVRVLVKVTEDLASLLVFLPAQCFF